jgi:D-galactarolactone cycloisomerase
MNRREFLQSSAALLTPWARAAEEVKERRSEANAADLKQFKITRVSGFTHVCSRPKLVGKNSHLDVHGWHTAEDVLRIATNQGIEGIGVGTTTPAIARKLLGHTLDEYWKPGIGVVSPLGRADHALFDLIAKALNIPAWKLFGGYGPEWVPIYDGSIYFNDLLPEHKEQGVARLLNEVEASLASGHRAFKIKVGRGFRWMDQRAGFQRDVEVVQAIRKLVGKDVRLMVDANNAFDLDSTMQWLDCAGEDLFFVEEMFPEEVEKDLQLKQHIEKNGWKTLVADGESAREISHFDPFLEQQALGVLQPDIRAFGLTWQWELSRKIPAKTTIKLAPHNWGSFLGLYMQLVLARGIPNFLIAEQDPSLSELFDTSAFQFKEGKIKVPETPGCGLLLREDAFERYHGGAWVVSSETI